LTEAAFAPHRIVADGLQFPEGPVAMPDGSIAFCEIARGSVSRLRTDGRVEEIAHTGGGPNGMAIGPDGALYVCNNGGFIWPQQRDANGWLRPVPGTQPDYTGGSIQRVNPATGEVRVLFTRCGDVSLFAPNDLVFDREGGFYFTDMGRIRQRDRDIGSVYYAHSDGSRISEVVPTIMQPNGIGLSPDQQTLYVAETETSRLWSFAIRSPGVVEKMPFPSPHGGRLVCGPGGYQRFDSLAVEAGGNICVATLVTGRILVITPDGRVAREVPLPDPQTTNLCFGGPGLRTAWVTQSYTGRLLALDWPDAGLPLNF
jgi:gluconolactonase